MFFSFFLLECHHLSTPIKCNEPCVAAFRGENITHLDKDRGGKVNGGEK